MDTLPSTEDPAAGRETVAHLNSVRLIGRLSDTPELRRLPSGDEIVVFRLVVTREVLRRDTVQPDRPGVTVDTLECTGWRADVRRSARSWKAGDVIEVSGALRRRFFRAGPTAASRYTVEVARVKRLSRTAGDAGVSRRGRRLA